MDKISRLVRSHLGPAIAATTAAVVLVGGVLILISLRSGGATAAIAPPTTSTTQAPSTAGASPGAALRHLGLRGTVTAIDGDTWTVTSARGASVTVDVSTSTTFGTKKSPLTASDFSVGQPIVAIGPRTGTTIMATRIAMAAAAAKPVPSTAKP